LYVGYVQTLIAFAPYRHSGSVYIIIIIARVNRK